MGEIARLTFFTTDESAAQLAAREAFDRIAALERVLSDYNPDSEAMRLCLRPVGEPHAVSMDLMDTLVICRDFYERTDGAFDITMGPTVALWRDTRSTHVLPTDSQLADALSKCGWHHVVLDQDVRSVTLSQQGMKLDFGGIGKGLAADEATRALQLRGIKRTLVAIGGDIVALDPPPGKTGWSIEVHTRSSPATSSLKLCLANRAVSTSGDLHQFVEIESVRYSHIIDPATGAALTTQTATTVIAPNGTTADALASAVCVLGPNAGIELLSCFPYCEARIAYMRNGSVHIQTSHGFVDFIDGRHSTDQSHTQGDEA